MLCPDFCGTPVLDNGSLQAVDYCVDLIRPIHPIMSHADGMDDVRRVLVLTRLVAVRAHAEALGEEGDFGEIGGHKTDDIQIECEFNA